MFELTTSNLDQELREQKIADGLRRRQLLATTDSQTPRAAQAPSSSPTRIADTASTARLATRRPAPQR